MMTVGYGDIVPQNSDEIAFTLVTVLCGCLVFGYDLNKIANIFQDMNKQQEQMQDKMNKINKFMEAKGIHANLQMRVRAYLNFLWQNQNQQLNEEILEMIGSLSDSLKGELYLQSYGEIIKRHCVLAESFSENFLYDLIRCMEEQNFMKNEIVFQEKDPKNNYLYFIISGEVEIFQHINQEQPPIILKKIQGNESFGEFSFFTGLNHIHSAKASQYSKVYKISHEKFLEVLSNFPNDYEKYCELKDKIILYENYNDLNLRCLICYKKDHLCNQCNLVHYIPNKESILLRHLFSKNMERKHSLRGRKKFNALFLKKKFKSIKKKIGSLLPYDSEDNISESNSVPISEKNILDIENVEQNKSSKDIIEENNNNQSLQRSPTDKKGKLNNFFEQEYKQISKLISLEEKQKDRNSHLEIEKTEIFG